MNRHLEDYRDSELLVITDEMEKAMVRAALKVADHYGFCHGCSKLICAGAVNGIMARLLVVGGVVAESYAHGN